MFCELADDGLISFAGEDAAAFLHAQLTSDVAGLRAPATQYTGYCTPKGRLLAVFLLWRLADEIVLELPAVLREPMQARLSKYILRAKVKAADAASRYTLFGVAGDAAAEALASMFSGIPANLHQVVVDDGIAIAAMPGQRYALLAPRERAASLRADLARRCVGAHADAWRARDVAAGIPVILEQAQEEYVPQMVNLDLLGGVSFAKGCYPGQEIVARTHYLGRVKQRMHRVRLIGIREAAVAQPFYSPAFGDQASGAILMTGAHDDRGVEALAVLQRSSVESADVRFGAPDGAPVEFLPLPYPMPD
jgi:folate-binding protein YgfZ